MTLLSADGLHGAVFARKRFHSLRQTAEFCHSERSEESLSDLRAGDTKKREILRFAQNDNPFVESAVSPAVPQRPRNHNGFSH